MTAAAPATPPTTPPPISRAQVLDKVLALATQFSACVEAFNLIHPFKDSDRHQRVALAKLGLQQGRLLIFGDVVGISSPPATIARHMIPSHPGATNPDPHLPVNFGLRDPRLDEPHIGDKVRNALDQISGRPKHMSREELMAKYGLKSPKRFSALEYPSLDTNRLEAFRERYGLLRDLVRQTGGQAAIKRGMSMAAQHWSVHDVTKFNEFVRTVRLEVDGLITLMGVKEQVDLGMKTDIKAFGWHPEMAGPMVRADWEKLKLIQEACLQDYPEYIDVTQAALKYLSEEFRGLGYTAPRPRIDSPTSPTHSQSGEDANASKKDKRPGILSRLKSWKSTKGVPRERSKSIANASSNDHQRSMSEDLSRRSVESDSNGLEPVRSKSLSAVPDEHTPFNLDSRLEGDMKLENVPTRSAADDSDDVDPLDTTPLTPANTVNTLIDRHDRYTGFGRIETNDIKNKVHDWA